MTVDCYGSMYRNLPAFPCVGFVRLNDMGLAGICESDLTSAMTFILLQALSGRPGFVSDPTVDSQVIGLKGSGADVLFVAGTPKFTAQAVRKVYVLGWRPLFVINNSASSIEATLKPAGLEKAVGLITAGYFKADPEQFAAEQARQEYMKFMKAYYPEGNVNEGANVYGYITAKAMEEVLKCTMRHVPSARLYRCATGPFYSQGNRLSAERFNCCIS